MERHQGHAESISGTMNIPEKTANVMTIVSLFEPFSRGIHTLLIEMDINLKKYWKSISQIELLTFIIKNLSLLHHTVKYQSLSNLNCINGQVKCVSADMNILEAYKMLDASRITALAISQPNNQELIGTLSLSDFTQVNESHLNLMDNLTVKQFLCAKHGNLRLPITASSSETFHVVLHRLVDSGVHRVWILDKNGKLEGLMSLSDVFKVLANSLTTSQSSLNLSNSL